MAEGEIRTRRADASDRSAILELCRTSLGWSTDDPDEAFFRWKHDENAFGVSPSWVAVAPDGALVGLRVFLRWRFRQPDGTTVAAVRAVDTATHPDWRGRSIFSTLTLGALPDLREEGVGMVFNTPNDKSMPGYLKMGWSQVGKVPVRARLGSPASLRRVAGARTAAELWSEAVTTGESAAAVFADQDAVDALLRRCPPSPAIATDRSAAFLAWRYRFEPLHYRVMPLGDALTDGVVVFRARRRGGALEATICDVVAPSRRGLRAALGRIRRGVGADYLLAGDRTAGLGEGFLPARGLGPMLTWMPLTRPGVPSLSSLELALGDIELF